MALAEQAEPGLSGGDQAGWLARLEAEHGNLRAALAYAVETADSSSALRLVVGVRRFWQIHGYLAEGRESLESALAATEGTPSELRANGFNMLGILAGEQGDFDAARVEFSAAAAEILKRFTGSDNFGQSFIADPGSSIIERGLTPRVRVTLSWATFTDAADQAGMSRRYGGIHFESDDVAGRALGRLVANEVWNKSITYIRPRGF